MIGLLQKIKRKMGLAKTASGMVAIECLFETAGVNSFDFHWPSQDETLRIGALLHHQAAEGGHIHRARLLATLLEVLADLPKPMAQRLALAYADEVEALIEAAFRRMKSKLATDDPRRLEVLPAILAGEVR